MTERKKIIYKTGLPIAIALLAAGAALVCVNFFSQKINAISGEIERKRILTAVLGQREQTIGRLKRDFDRIGDYQTRLDRATPEVDNLSSFLAAVDGLGKKYSVAQAVSLEPPKVLSADTEGRALFSVSYRIDIGRINLAGLINYLAEFEKLPYFASIDSVNLETDARGWNDSSEIRLSGKLYAKN